MSSVFQRCRTLVLFGAVLATSFLMVAGARGVKAEGTFISAPGRVDLVYDLKRDTLYIARKELELAPGGPVVLESEVLRYHVGTRTFLEPIPVFGDLGGIDLSPDGDTLLVADRRFSKTKLWVHQVDLTDLTVRTAEVERPDSGEGGTHAVAFGNDGAALVTSYYQGSGWTPLRRYDPTSGAWSSLGQVTTSMVTASPDGSVIGIAEGGISDGRWGSYRVLDGYLVRRQGYQQGTEAFNFEIGVENGGTQYAFPALNGAKIYDGSFARKGTIGSRETDQPIGVAYHPFDRLVYFAMASDTGSSWVRAYRTTDLQPLAQYDFESPFDSQIQAAFSDGRLRIAGDGSYLFATVNGGVRFVQLAPHRPVAAELTVRTRVNAALPLPQASYSPTETLTYDIVQAPRRGTLSGTAPDLVYTPARGFRGQDRFVYRVHDGASYSSTAAVTVLVSNFNRAPLAEDDAASSTGNPVEIQVLANDTDPDGDRLTISSVTGPAHGRVKLIAKRTLRYIPNSGASGTDRFIYLISDRKGGTSSATVTVQVGGTP